MKSASLVLLCCATLPLVAAKNPPAKTSSQAKTSSAAVVNAPYNAGVKLYTEKNYRAAAQQFEEAMKISPNSADVIYYCALCQQLSNNRTRAKQLFEYITTNFPTSRVAGMAQTALGQLTTLSSSGGTGSSSSSDGGASVGVSSGSLGRGRRDAELASVPDLVKIPFEKHGNDIIVQMSVNGHVEPFILDTGAQSVAIGANHLKEWGVGVESSKDTYEIGGVGDGKAKGWQQSLDLKLGPIMRKGFPCSIQDNMPGEPLLGQTFLRGFNVNVDEGSRTVMLAKKTSSAARDIAHRSYNGVEIPFRRLPSGHMMVDIKVNGKAFPIMFDTGCERTSFAQDDWKQLGFAIPPDAQQGKAIGVLGETTAWYFNAESIKLGAIEQSPSPISVTEGSKHSLLGMSFYGKMKYTIDTTRSVIIFENKD